MSRFLVALSGAFFLGAEARSAEAPEPVTAPDPPPTSQVFFAHDPAATNQFIEAPGVTRRMVDRPIMAVTNQASVAGAWRSLVSSSDRVGIKVATAGGSLGSSHVGVVEALVAGLEQAGIPRRQVIVWDRESTGLGIAGFASRRGGYQVRAIDPPDGYDREATITAPVLGRLIWGDLLFMEKTRRPFGRASEPDQLSSTSHLASVLSKEVTKVINVPVLSDDLGCGVAGAFYNMTVRNIDNWRRFTQPGISAAGAIPSIYADQRVGGKVVLHVMDSLLAQYAGGPGFDPNYAFAHNTLYASRDPVALDATALRKLDHWRKEARLPPIGRTGEWQRNAEEMGLGHFAGERITVVPV
ncbi:MAG: DUF362 domain-containing protein, partial [Verrucomicrobiota bacterium]|nr:DUF362 domain-containing protein [Verrucomicrobiota bacterium]